MAPITPRSVKSETLAVRLWHRIEAMLLGPGPLDRLQTTTRLAAGFNTCPATVVVTHRRARGRD